MASVSAPSAIECAIPSYRVLLHSDKMTKYNEQKYILLELIAEFSSLSNTFYMLGK